MSEQNKVLIRRWFKEVWNQGRMEAVDEMLAGNGVLHNLSDEPGTPPGKPMIGPQGFRPFWQKFQDAFSEIDIAVDDTIAEGDMVVARCTARGRHTGDALGFPATHRSVVLSGMVIARIRNGKIAEVWTDFDFMGLYQQIGAIRLL